MHHRAPNPGPARRLTGRHALAAAAAAAVLLAGACSSTDEPPAKSTTTTAASEGSSRPGTTEGTAGDKSEEADTDQSARDPWNRSAEPYRGEVGEEVEFDCPAGGDPAPVWGTNLYTDDSSVCTAAVHVGLITFEDGGAVTIRIEEGADEYQGSSFNDVDTASYGRWPGSFSFPDAETLDAEATIDWNRRANSFEGTGETVITVVCDPDGSPGSVWGTGTYTDDSSICTAAVHAGLIDLADGGEVTFELVAGLDAYEGSTANGVTSSDYGSWSGSFVFVED